MGEIYPCVILVGYFSKKNSFHMLYLFKDDI